MPAAKPRKAAKKTVARKSAKAGRKAPATVKKGVKSLKAPQPILLKQFAPTFPAADVRRAVNWYKEVMGFSVSFMHEDPSGYVYYGGVTRGPVKLHIAGVLPDSPLKKSAAYLFLSSGVDEYAAQIYARGGNIIAALKDHPYGMRECTVEDLDGNHIYVGQPTGR